MRIYLSGDENAARWHLPVAQAKVREFAQETQKAGIKQNRFTFLFKETGAIVHAQYVFGQVSMQVHAPFIPLVEEPVEEPVDVPVGPKTFWVNTTQGYFWVEVRYTDGVPRVILTPFEAIAGDGWVYPGFELTAPGMISGTLDGTPESRYVLSQNGGVMAGVDEEKGTIKSTAIIDSTSRLTVVENSIDVHDFILIKNDGGQAAEVRRIGISYVDGAFDVERQYASVAMAYEGESNLYVTNLLPNPVWVHRKCSGSYFSPNKTIGYHVDIGADDGFLGNMQEVRGGDLLDNTGGFGEALFNHTPDLYRLASILAFPISASPTTIDLMLVSPTMGFIDDQNATKKCWGGYGMTQSWAGCVDYQQDFSSWLLAPRFVRCSIDFSTGAKSFVDPALGGNCSEQFPVTSWDGAFSGTFFYDAEYSCDNKFYSEMETKPASGQCSWTEGCSWTCDTNDPGSNGECPKGWTPYSHWEYFSRENILNSKHAYFLFGKERPTPESPSIMHGFYILFDGLWHLDIGVFWTSSRIEGNYCGLCMFPWGSQEPGENVYFSVQGADTEWVREHGHEYVRNMDIVTPLGDVPWPLGGTVLGFIAKVPESYAAPHDPVMLLGGVEYPSEDVEGEVVYCERALMSDPCDCEGSSLSFDEYSTFSLESMGTVTVVGGCPPFEWHMQGAHDTTTGRAYVVTESRSLLIAVTDECSALVTVKDACGNTATLDDEYVVNGAIAGSPWLNPGQEGYYTHNLGAGATYSGDLELVEMAGTSAVLRMPSGANGGFYSVIFTGRCGKQATKEVNCGEFCPHPVQGDGFPHAGTLFSSTNRSCCLRSTGESTNRYCTQSTNYAENADDWVSLILSCGSTPVGGSIGASVGHRYKYTNDDEDYGTICYACIEVYGWNQGHCIFDQGGVVTWRADE